MWFLKVLLVVAAHSLHGAEASFIPVENDMAAAEATLETETLDPMNSGGHQEEEKEEGSDLLGHCRRDPTWTSDYEACSQVTGWDSYGRSDYWWKKSYAARQRHVGHENEEQIRACLHTKMAHNDWAARCNGTDNCEGWDPSVSSVYKHFEEGTLVMVENVLTEQEAFAVEFLASCIHEILPMEMPFFEERPFGDEEEVAQGNGVYDVSGGNYCTFIAGFVQMYLPGVASSIYRAVETAYDVVKWEDKGYTHPTDLGLRTSEFLEYKKTGHLGRHVDGGSIFTISIMMSEADEYEGGYFHLDTEQALFKLPRLSGIVFISEDMHGITPILSGERKVFVTELWEEEDVPIGEARPDADQFEEYKHNVREREKEYGYAFEVGDYDDNGDEDANDDNGDEDANHEDANHDDTNEASEGDTQDEL